MQSWKKNLGNFAAEVFVWMLLSTITEVWVTATVERLSLGDRYIMASVPFWSLQGHTTMWQWTVGISLTVGLRILFYLQAKYSSATIWMSNRFAFAFVVMILIYIAEYLSGLFFNVFLGFHLWDYSQYHIGNIPLNLQGQITIVYAPFWYLAGLLVKPVYKAVHSIAPYTAVSIANLLDDIEKIRQG